MILGIIRTVVYLIAFVFAYIATFRCYKSEKKLNGVTWLMISFVLELCVGALAAGIIDIINIPVNLWSMSAINLIWGGVVQYRCVKEKKVQQYVWERFDVVYLAVLFVILSAFFIHFKGVQIQMKFYNSDAGVHFKNSMSIVRSGHLRTMYFSELWTAMTIHCFLPVIKEVNAYKIFILVDHFFLFLEIEMFMILLREYAKTTQAKIVAVFLSVLYALGYPALSYLYSFFYWGIGVLLIGALLLFAKYYQENQMERGKLVLVLMVTCNAITMCYMLFGPLCFVMLFLYLTYVYGKEHHKLDGVWVVLCLKVFLVPTILAVYYCYFGFLSAANLSVGEVINTTGGSYFGGIRDFYWLIPLGIYLFIHCIRERKFDMVMISGICNALLVLVFMGLCSKGHVSVYYASKFYYPLWLLGYIIAFQAICKILEKYSKMIVCYLVIVACFISGYFVKYEKPIVSLEVSQLLKELPNPKLRLYGHNCGVYRSSWVQYADEYMKVCNYVIENLKQEKEVPMLAAGEEYSYCYWYEAITGRDSAEYFGWTQEFSEIQEKLESRAVNYFVVYKNTAMYTSYQDYFETFDKVYDNDLAMVCSTAK